mmetsp:Transcript_121309/g.343297  ORF Transcript_121309/g.343297 Transcript_121309/m.343297 type:complete len:215 (-) Transcript_121309:282-926(-)
MELHHVALVEMVVVPSSDGMASKDHSEGVLCVNGMKKPTHEPSPTLFGGPATRFHVAAPPRRRFPTLQIHHGHAEHAGSFFPLHAILIINRLLCYSHQLQSGVDEVIHVHNVCLPSVLVPLSLRHIPIRVRSVAGDRAGPHIIHVAIEERPMMRFRILTGATTGASSPVLSSTVVRIQSGFSGGGWCRAASLILDKAVDVVATTTRVHLPKHHP